MAAFKDLLKENPIIILDGALGTELENLGYDVTGKLWSAKYLVDKPEIIQDLHAVYLRAGSDIVTTASYQATLPGLIESGLSEEKALSLIASTVTLAQKARQEVWESLKLEEQENRPYPLVAGSVGPYAAYLADGSEYTGDYDLTVEEFKDFHRPRVQALLDAGADLLALETIPNGVEVKALLDLLAEEFPDAEAFLSFTAQSEKALADGTLLREVAQLAQKNKQFLAIGINCTAPHLISSLLGEIRAVSDKPLVTYPNSGEIYDGKTQTWHEDPDQSHTLLENSLIWKEAGARIVGGCCRTRPADIAALAQHFRKKD